jgi:hypothetical protein
MFSELTGNKFEKGTCLSLVDPSPNWLNPAFPHTKSLLKLLTTPIDHPLLDEMDDIVSDASRASGTTEGG